MMGWAKRWALRAPAIPGCGETAWMARNTAMMSVAELQNLDAAQKLRRVA